MQRKTSSTIQVWNPGLLDKLVEGKGLEEAKKRVNITGKKYLYTPSPEYQKLRATMPKRY